MRTAIIKSYRVPHFSQDSDWYEIALLIQRGKSSTMYVIKTCDKKVYEALTSSCLQEVKNELCNIAEKMVAKSCFAKVALHCFYCKMKSHQCQMKNYHKTYIM